MNCKECFHYKACLDVDREGNIYDGEFPETCDHFIESKYVEIDEVRKGLDSLFERVCQKANKERKRIQQAMYEEILKTDNTVVDEDGNSIEFDRDPSCRDQKISVLNMNGPIDISKEIALLGRNMKHDKVIAVDFDGTLCENKWPDIGKPNYTVINYLKREKKNGAKIILWTCRMGERLDNAVNWCKKHNLEFDTINENLPEIVDFFGDDSRKICADEYIDDKNNTKFKLPFKKPVKKEMKKERDKDGE